MPSPASSGWSSSRVAGAIGPTSSASNFPLVKSSFRKTKIAPTNMTTTIINANRIFPVVEMINPVNAGPIALDPLSVMAYNYQLGMSAGGGV